MNTGIATGVAEGNVYDIEDMVNSALAAGEDPKGLLEAMMAGLKTCGDRFESGEYFLPELMGAGEAFTIGMKVLAPQLAPGDRTSQGTVVLGTVRGDVHVRGAVAYSTLGWFDDPILSTMIYPNDRAIGELVNDILHESVHATIYINGQSFFNGPIGMVD